MKLLTLELFNITIFRNVFLRIIKTQTNVFAKFMMLYIFHNVP